MRVWTDTDGADKTTCPECLGVDVTNPSPCQARDPSNGIPVEICV